MKHAYVCVCLVASCMRVCEEKGCCHVMVLWANNTRSSEKHFERERDGGRAVQARDGWRESGSEGC